MMIPRYLKIKILRSFVGHLTKNGNRSRAFKIMAYILSNFKRNRQLFYSKEWNDFIAVDPLNRLATLVNKIRLPVYLKTKILPGRKKRSRRVKVPFFFINDEQSINFIVKLICQQAFNQNLSGRLEVKLLKELFFIEEGKGATLSWLKKYKQEILATRFGNKTKITGISSVKKKVERSLYFLRNHESSSRSVRFFSKSRKLKRQMRIRHYPLKLLNSFNMFYGKRKVKLNKSKLDPKKIIFFMFKQRRFFKRFFKKFYFFDKKKNLFTLKSNYPSNKASPRIRIKNKFADYKRSAIASNKRKKPFVVEIPEFNFGAKKTTLHFIDKKFKGNSVKARLEGRKLKNIEGNMRFRKPTKKD